MGFYRRQEQSLFPGKIRNPLSLVWKLPYYKSEKSIVHGLKMERLMYLPLKGDNLHLTADKPRKHLPTLKDSKKGDLAEAAFS